MKVSVERIGLGIALVRMDQVGRVVDISDLPPDALGQITPEIENDLVEKFKKAGPPERRRPDADLPKHVQSRRKKMIEIGEQSVASRGRVFKSMPHIHLMDQHRHIDVIAMYARGRLKDSDKIVTRNLKSGEYEEVTVGSLLDEIEETFHLRQKLRAHDQAYRDRINAIFNAKTTDEEKAAQIEAFEVPEFLDIDEESTSAKLVSRKNNNGRT